MKLFVIIFMVTLVCNCNAPSSIDFISLTYLKRADSILLSKDTNMDTLFFKSENGTYVAEIDYYSPGKVHSISGRLLDRNYGHYFIMTPRNTLERYLFNVGDEIHNSYSIKMTKNGEYSELGDPFVDYVSDQSCTGLNDSLKCFYLIFSSFPRRKLKASISFDNIDYQPLDLKLSKFMPFIWEYDLLIPKSTVKIFYKIEAEGAVINLNGINPTKFFHDSLSLE